ncbi:MAG: DNA primase [Candidatus Marinimicrobia bacterium]|nr:DNA primase [Candidatus Neomarinimicrobiota bacterium]
MSQIPQDIIERVRDSADIVDVVSQYVDLKQRGPNFFGLCPFHNEKTPSFSVAPAKQIYYCFGCNSGGNAFSFLMDYQQISFPDAVKVLADRYNIPISLERSDGDSELYSSLYKLHEIAVQLYQDNLFSKSGQKALSYLKDRGLNEDMIKQFKIGFAEDSWDQLVKKCKGRGFTRSQIVQSGLFSQSDKGTFDRFRSRIMFPVFHPSGKPIAFGGRIFESDDPAKYLNSPETPLYKKSNVFYGLQATRDAIRKEGHVILVEGYMDFIKLYQSAIHPVVSVSGTAFTSRHASSIAKITQKVILLYDGDGAGGNAAIRAGWVLYRSGLIPSVVRPPNGLDPDDWIDRSGSSELLSAIDSPIDYIDFHMDFNKGVELKGTDRQQYIMILARELRSIEDGVIRNDLIKAISEKLSIEEHDLIRTVNTQRVNPEQNYEDEFVDEGKIVFSSQVDKAQVEILQLLIGKDIELKRNIIDQIELELFTNPLLNQLAKILFDKNLDVESSSIIEYFQDKNERDSIAQILFTKDQNSSSEEIVSDCIKILRSEPIKEKISSLRIEIREKESKGEDPVKELDAITKLRSQLNDL